LRARRTATDQEIRPLDVWRADVIAVRDDPAVAVDACRTRQAHVRIRLPNTGVRKARNVTQAIGEIVEVGAVDVAGDRAVVTHRGRATMFPLDPAGELISMLV
jgi:hypothetical protein